MVAVSAPSWEVPMAVMGRHPRLWAYYTRHLIYSMGMPGTVPGAGRRMMSAPACAKLYISSRVMMCSPPSEITPEACIFPAASTSRSPSSFL